MTARRLPEWVIEPLKPILTGLTASECNAAIRALPRPPLHGDT